MFKLSTTNSHEPSRSVATVCSMWLAKSAAVRGGPIVGRSHSPVVTTMLAIRHKVPFRVYSNSISARFPAISGLVGAFRSSACIPVISSTPTVWTPRLFSNAGVASYVSQTALACAANLTGSFSVVWSPYRLWCGGKTASRRSRATCDGEIDVTMPRVTTSSANSCAVP